MNPHFSSALQRCPDRRNLLVVVCLSTSTAESNGLNISKTVWRTSDSTQPMGYRQPGHNLCVSTGRCSLDVGGLPAVFLWSSFSFFTGSSRFLCASIMMSVFSKFTTKSSLRWIPQNKNAKWWKIHIYFKFLINQTKSIWICVFSIYLTKRKSLSWAGKLSQTVHTVHVHYNVCIFMTEVCLFPSLA